jgi:xanthine/CO dehydrogenase XdhC/CoxF family maturation factor
MPQILRGFGFTDAVVWRGVPSSVDRSAFWWRSPDGSQVRAEYLPDGYGNGAATPDDAKELVARIHQFVDHWGDLVDGPVLWMNGTDHELPQPWLGRVVAEANDIQDDFTIVVGPLLDYQALAPTDNQPAHTGELRSGARANLLMGVASNRVDIKQAATAAERWLEQVAEPAAALFSAPAAWPGELLGSAWRQVVLNSAHDSSCACSLDEVCDAVGVRYAEARSLAAGVAERAAADLAARLAGEGTVVANTTARPRSGVVAVTIPGRHPAPGTQVVAQLGGEQPTDPLVAGDAAEVLRMVLAWDRSLTHVELLGPDTEGVIAAHPRRQGEPLAGGEVLPIANALTRLLVGLDCRITCYDTRREWLDRLPESPRLTPVLSHDLPGEVADLPDQASVLLMTMGHATDSPILAEILRARSFPYLGVIGSASKARRLRKDLEEAGIPAEARHAFHCPIGLPLGNNHPLEISISIAAQLLQVRHTALVRRKT